MRCMLIRMHSHEMDASEMDAAEMDAADMDVAEMDTTEKDAAEMDADEMMDADDRTPVGPETLGHPVFYVKPGHAHLHSANQRVPDVFPNVR